MSFRVGLVGYWFNRGQATLVRGIRSILESQGIDVFVLARPTQSDFAKPSYVASEGVWDQPRVKTAGSFLITEEECNQWARENRLDVVIFFQNYQFDVIRAVRDQGIKTVGWFVWESFSQKHVRGAQQALDVIYSHTLCEQRRYAEFGIDSPLIPWGCQATEPPVTQPDHRAQDGVDFIYSAGYQSLRKATAETLAAFTQSPLDNISLTVKSQRPIANSDLYILGHRFQFTRGIRRVWRGGAPRLRTLAKDTRISFNSEDMDQHELERLYARHDVMISMSRWEGLNLNLYEALSAGMPVIAPDMPPDNEVIKDGVNGLLVSGRYLGEINDGVGIFQPDVNSIRAAIETAADREVLARLQKGVADSVREWSLDRTTEGLLGLMSSLGWRANAG